MFAAVSSAFQFAGVIHWISLVILSVFFSEVGGWILGPRAPGGSPFLGYPHLIFIPEHRVFNSAGALRPMQDEGKGHTQEVEHWPPFYNPQRITDTGRCGQVKASRAWQRDSGWLVGGKSQGEGRGFSDTHGDEAG